MSPHFNEWLCYPVFVFIGILTQVNLVQKSAETFIPFWELPGLIVELILKPANGKGQQTVVTAAQGYLPAFNQAARQRTS